MLQKLPVLLVWLSVYNFAAERDILVCREEHHTMYHNTHTIARRTFWYGPFIKPQFHSMIVQFHFFLLKMIQLVPLEEWAFLGFPRSKNLMLVLSDCVLRQLSNDTQQEYLFINQMVPRFWYHSWSYTAQWRWSSSKSEIARKRVSNNVSYQ